MSIHRLALLVTTIVLAAGAGAAAASAEDVGGSSIAYSVTYLELIALFPGGYAPNGCELAVALSGTTGVCTAEFAPVWFYPDGTTGGRAWQIDRSAAAGWSVEADPCATAFAGTDPDIDWWPRYIDYLDWFLGWTSTRPEGITDPQGGCLIQIYGF